MMLSKENRPFDPAEVLRMVEAVSASLDAELTPEDRQAMKQRTGDDVMSSLVYSADERETAMSDFDMLAAGEALEALANEVQSFCERRMEEAYRRALEVYYTAEELSCDPEHAELLPHVDSMRRAHEEQYGRPIPPKNDLERR